MANRPQARSGARGLDSRVWILLNLFHVSVLSFVCDVWDLLSVDTVCNGVMQCNVCPVKRSGRGLVTEERRERRRNGIRSLETVSWHHEHYPDTGHWTHLVCFDVLSCGPVPRHGCVTFPASSSKQSVQTWPYYPDIIMIRSWYYPE